MKLIRKTLGTLLILGGFIASTNLLPAQETETAIQAEPLSLTPADVAAFPTLSEAQAAALVSALEATPTIPVESGTLGTFYSLQHPEWPPLPADLSGSSVWTFGTFCLLSDLNYSYQAAAGVSLMKSGRMQAMTLDIPSPEDGGDTNGYGTYASSYTPADYGTNLWLIITNVAGSVADLVLSNTLPDVPYEIQANADLARTNWVFAGWVYGSEETNWTPVSVVATNDPTLFYRVRSWADDGSGLPVWWQQQYGVSDPYGDPDEDGWNNLQELHNGTDPTFFNQPPTPQGLTANLNHPDDTANIDWLPSPGVVTGYTLEKIYGYIWDETVQDFPLSASVTSYLDSLSANIPNPLAGNAYSVYYRIKANYPNGNSSAWSTFIPLQRPTVSAAINTGPNGTMYLTVQGIPANATTVRLSFIDTGAVEFFEDVSFDYEESIPVSAFTNNSYQLPAEWQPPGTDAYHNADYDGYVASVDASGNASAAALAYSSDRNWTDSFFDGREQLKQNLVFLLRAGLVDYSFPITPGLYNHSAAYSISAYPTDYVYSALYVTALDATDPNNQRPMYFDSSAPFEANYLFRNFVFNSTNLNANGHLKGWFGAFDGGGFPAEYHLGALPFQFQPPVTNSVLGINDTRWLGSYPLDSPEDYLGEIGITSPNYTLAGNARNIYGLPFLSAKIASSSGTTTLNANDSTTQDGYFYPETAQPQLQTVEYDFWRTSDPLPGYALFSPTNQSQLFVVTPFSSVQIAGYAKLAVQNGYSGVYGYLGQYFDQAYKITNGVVTTNTTGILSPYGSFFATEPGPAALLTMPDIDTGERGTATVYTVSAVIDRTQGSTMDLSFNDANATSAGNPAPIWANNNYDRGHTVDGTDSEQDDLGPVDIQKYNLVPDCQYTTNGYPAIPCTRDLEDYFRLWTPGVAALMKAMPNNYTVQLTLTGDAQIRIFQAVEPDGGTNYLFDETTASNQVVNSASLYVGLLTSGSPIVFNIQTNFNEHFLFCGARTGSAQVDLQILDDNLNVLADSPVYLQINDIKQMYERWTVGEDPKAAPMNVATNAVEDLPQFASAFQYPLPPDTNTPYILFVHGWNQETWEKDRYAEAAYKRLYWQGYQGRFGSFRWPTGNGFDASFSDILTDARNYDNSEFTAWQSATGLTNLLTKLNAKYPGNVYLMAHSMGNVVAGEALRQASSQLVNTYIAMQGAVPAHAYDPNAPTRVLGPLGVQDSGTPNCYAEYYTSGASCYFDASAGAGAYVNFYNTNDYALDKWQIDQNVKPDNAKPPGYHYSSSSGFYKIIGAQTNSTTYLNFPADTYEIFAYGDEARCFALGAQADVNGVFNKQQVDLHSVWVIDPHSGHDFSAHVWHSAQFRSDNPSRAVFWNSILSGVGFNLK